MFRKMRIRKKNVCSFFHFKIQSCRQQQEMIWIELVFSKKWNMWPFKIHIENLQDVGVNFIIRIFHCFFFLLLKVNFNEAAYKNKQMLTKCSKERSTGSMAGYFDNEFKILSSTYIDPISMRRQARIEEKKKNIVPKPFVTMYRPRDPYVNHTVIEWKYFDCVFAEKDWVHSMER